MIACGFVVLCLKDGRSSVCPSLHGECGRTNIPVLMALQLKSQWLILPMPAFPSFFWSGVPPGHPFPCNISQMMMIMVFCCSDDKRKVAPCKSKGFF